MLITETILPVVKTVGECADYTTTIKPYLPQLWTLPQEIWKNIGDINALKGLYYSTNPFVSGLSLAIALAPVFLVISEVNKNYSQVDRMWSLLPTIYIAHYTYWTHLHELPTERLDTALMFSAIWSARLTFNYWRRGGYSIGSEDYRWLIVKNYIGEPWMFLFNVTFISLVQSLLLFAITLPAYIFVNIAQLTTKGTVNIAQVGRVAEMNTGDYTFSRILVGLVLVEFFADQQQWNYQGAKKEYQATAKVPRKYTQTQLDRGFVTSGLWGLVRHPNFAAEQAIWVGFYQWACFETDTLYNYAAIGAIQYLALFQGSTWLTERITAGKYPDYKTYQKRVARFVPKLKAYAEIPFPGDEADRIRLAAEAEGKNKTQEAKQEIRSK